MIYQITRFLDRDMGMRYHWGLGVGHQYAHTRLFMSKADGDLRNDEILTGETEDEAFEGQDSESDSEDDDIEWSRPFM
jgi:hypothetical protein